MVQCDFARPRAVLDETRRCLDRVLGPSPHPLLDAAALHLRAGLRRHLLGEAPENTNASRYAELFDRAAATGQTRIALLLRDVDRADPSSLELLLQLFGGTRLPKLPMLLSFDSARPAGAAGRLLDQLRHVLPTDAFFWQSAPVDPLLEALPPTLPSGWLSLRAPVRGLLRASAIIGDRFESAILSQLFEVDEPTVLAALQEAVDHGIAIEDGGHGNLRFEHSLGEALRTHTLPSLARAWHEQLAQLFGGPPAPVELTEPMASTTAQAAPESESETSFEAQRAAATATPDAGVAALATEAPLDLAAADEPQDANSRAVVAPDATQCFGEASDPIAPAQDPRREEWWQQLEADLLATRTASAPARELAQAVSEPRAASHAAAAGLWELAGEQHLAAAQRASLAGAHVEALEHTGQALLAAARIADRERSRQVRSRALLLTGHSRWQYRGPNDEFSLAAALEPLARCRALLTESDPAELRAELGVLIANVQYDLGTPEALEQALRELTLAGQLLLDAGQPLEAARLLNDEAAVWVKLGDPVRANYLLTRSRDVFSRVAGSHPQARTELAETEHLLARLLLHAVPRPGRERDALQLGVQHALAAEETYREGGQPRQLGRVWETLGCLELRLGHLDAASHRLREAHQLQQQLGDSIGLARSSAALAAMLAERHEYPAALQWLGESIALNSAKGSVAGLELNLASLRQLEGQLPHAFHAQARDLEQRLRLSLPRKPSVAVSA
ncbi:MAG: hypothetical protein RL685_166 [Pseudomonadota bacterium]